MLAKWRVKAPWSAYGQPLNGQARRARALDHLGRAFDPDGIVETGTLVGHTTAHLAGFGVPVLTAETDSAFHRVAKLRLRRRANVEALRMDSRVMIGLLSERRRFRRPLFYLDAHWGVDPPLTGELEEIAAGWSDAVVMIDDFQVPGDDGYWHDTYAGQALSRDSLPEIEAVVAFPAHRSDRESGARRGTAYLGMGPAGRAAVAALVAAGELRYDTTASAPGATP